MVSPSVSDESAARREYSAALRLVHEQPEKAIAALEQFLRTHSRSVLADDASLQLARLQHETGAPVAALRTLENAIQRMPTADRSDEVRLLLAQWRAERGELQAAYDVARRIRFSRIEAAERRASYRLLANLAAQLQDPRSQLRWLGALWEEASTRPGQEAIEQETREVLSHFNEASLKSLQSELSPERPVFWVILERVERRRLAGDVDAAKQLLEGLDVSHTLSAGEAAALRQAKEGLADSQADWLLATPVTGFSDMGSLASLMQGRIDGTVGVVLPLSGPYSDFGDASLRGILLAAGYFDPGLQATRRGLRLLIRDSGGDPSRAVAAVREFAANPEVVAMIGPLLAEESEAAAASAEDLQLPLLSLSRHESIAQGRSFVIRLGGTPRLEAELMAAYAVETLGLRRFAILYPDLEFGYEMRAAFWRAVEARGGEVVGVARYSSDATDFAAPIRHLVGYDFLSWESIEAIRERDRMLKRAKRLPPEEAAELRSEARALTGADDKPLPPFVDFEALFIPDSYETVGLIGPHLAFHSVKGVRLLGTSAWNDPELLHLADGHLDGAVFAAGSLVQSERPEMAEFQSRSLQIFGSISGDLTAAAFDAANLAAMSLMQAGKERSAFLPTLRRLHGWPGASGHIWFNPEGQIWKRPHLVGIERGRWISVDERGEPPYLHVPEPELPCEDGMEDCTATESAGDPQSSGEVGAKRQQ